MTPELKKKISAIYAISQGKLGLDNDLIHDIVNNLTNKTSLRDLTIPEANKVIASLLKSTDTGTKPKRKTSGKISYLITPAQIAKLEKLGEQMMWGPEQLDKFSLRQYKKPLKQLKLQQAQGLIEALKSIIERPK